MDATKTAQPAHTPGPWKSDGCIVRTGGNIADYVADCTPLGLIIREQGEANAQLIACAPEMLALITAWTDSKVDASWIVRERARIIAKATGVQS